MRSQLISLLSIILLIVSCQERSPQEFSVIPNPKKVELSEGVFALDKADIAVSDGLDERVIGLVRDFADQLSLVSGHKVKVKNLARRGCKCLIIRVDSTLRDEYYSLAVTPDEAEIRANSYNGFLYAFQTISQMLPVQFYGHARAKADYVLPCVNIEDGPRFGYRGLLIDVGRHFYDVDEIKKCIDIMSIYKLNVLHWHLTEDQGWRIEIKKYPRLTEIGSIRHGTQIDYNPKHLRTEDHKGFYTQDQLRDVVAYAAKKGITIIPELDLPGHMLSALAAYPELGCTGGPYEVANTWGVKKDVLCVGKEETFTFLEDVLTEIMDIFPSEYINIGGDEVPKDRWNACPRCRQRMKDLGLKDRDGHTAGQYLQNYVTARIQKFLNEHGRRIIGWEEILEGDLAEGATVMTWKGTAENVDQRLWNYDCIMSPRGSMYIDRYQSHEQDREPFSIGAYLPVENVYAYEPYDGVPEYGKPKIMGVQANLWTEYIGSNEYLEYMLLPRLAALSEVQWCAEGTKDYDRFRKALDHSAKIYEQMGYTYCKYAWGIVGLAPDEQPARTDEELQLYLNSRN